MTDLPLENLAPDSDRAAFRQIADHLRTLIEDGDLREGDKIPSEARLIGHYGVARMTVRQALQLLQGEGLVVAEHGRGVFVRTRPPVRHLAPDRFARQDDGADSVQAGLGPGAEIDAGSVVVGEEDALGDIAERLGLRPGDRVVTRACRYLHDGHPVATATSYLPARIASGTPITGSDSAPADVYATLEQLGHRPERFTEEVRARMPLGDEARTLGIPSGVPVFHVIRVAYDEAGKPVEVCDGVMSSNAYVLHYELPGR